MVKWKWNFCLSFYSIRSLSVFDGAKKYHETRSFADAGQTFVNSGVARFEIWSNLID